MVSLILAAAGLVACGSDPDELAAGPGRQVYLLQCAACHGADRGGIGTAPGLTESRMVELGEPEVRRLVTDGGSTMPAFGTVLTDQQLDALVAYLQTGEG
jgi:quinoprotein glucose dehydrogenase